MISRTRFDSEDCFLYYSRRRDWNKHCPNQFTSMTFFLLLLRGRRFFLCHSVWFFPFLKTLLLELSRNCLTRCAKTEMTIYVFALYWLRCNNNRLSFLLITNLEDRQRGNCRRQKSLLGIWSSLQNGWERKKKKKKKVAFKERHWKEIKNDSERISSLFPRSTFVELNWTSNFLTFSRESLTSSVPPICFHPFHIFVFKSLMFSPQELIIKVESLKWG